MSVKSIVHITSAHPRNDIRIYHKMCLSGKARNYKVTLLVADGKGDGESRGIDVRDIGRPAGRIDRVIKSPKRMRKMAASLEADMYQLHDPELIPLGRQLKRLGKKVIFDAHEDVPKQLLAKHYLDKVTSFCLSKAFAVYESRACRIFDGIVAATPSICEKFARINPNTVNISNFPLLDELNKLASPKEKAAEICYIGCVSAIRGIRELVAAMGLTQSGARLNLCGEFEDGRLEQELKKMDNWKRVHAWGWLGRPEIANVMARSVAGMMVLHPTANHFSAQPNKMFEYMSAGLPVVASDFPLWREIVIGNNCGLIVDPFKPAQIAAAIDELIFNPERASRMGQNGRKAVVEKYNWRIEERKLFAFYENILARTTR